MSEWVGVKVNRKRQAYGQHGTTISIVATRHPRASKLKEAAGWGVTKGYKGTHNALAFSSTKPPHHAVIDEPEPPVLEHDDIAWVWVCVVDTIYQQLVPVHLHQRLENRAEVNRQRCSGWWGQHR